MEIGLRCLHDLIADRLQATDEQDALVPLDVGVGSIATQWPQRRRPEAGGEAEEHERVVSSVQLAHLCEEPRDKCRRERVGFLLGVGGVLARVEGIHAAHRIPEIEVDNHLVRDLTQHAEDRVRRRWRHVAGLDLRCNPRLPPLDVARAKLIDEQVAERGNQVLLDDVAPLATPGRRPDLAEVQLPLEDVSRVRVKLRRGRRLLGDNPGADLLQLALQPSKCVPRLAQVGQRPVDLAHLAAAWIDGAASHTVATCLPAPDPRQLGLICDHVAPALDPLDALRPVRPLRRLPVVAEPRGQER